MFERKDAPLPSDRQEERDDLADGAILRDGDQALEPGRRRLIRRALQLRCPHCGARGVRDGYFDYKPWCPQCGLRFDRGEDDYWIGGFMLNFIVGELIAVAAVLGAIAVLWPEVPWRPVLYASLVPAALGPLIAYPFSRNLWLALDLVFRPPEHDDFHELGQSD